MAVKWLALSAPRKLLRWCIILCFRCCRKSFSSSHRAMLKRRSVEELRSKKQFYTSKEIADVQTTCIIHVVCWYAQNVSLFSLWIGKILQYLYVPWFKNQKNLSATHFPCVMLRHRCCCDTILIMLGIMHWKILLWVPHWNDQEQYLVLLCNALSF